MMQGSGGETPRRIFGTMPSNLAINVSSALFDSHKHPGKGIHLQHHAIICQSLNHAKRIINGYLDIYVR